MLTKIIIERLFNLYTYDIDLTNDDGSMLKFLTAPNGYGKTTLLDLVHEVMTGANSRLFNTPFGRICLVFFDETTGGCHSVEVQRILNWKPQEVNSDSLELDTIQLVYTLKSVNDNEEERIEQFSMVMDADGEISKNGASNNTEMFFISRTCHYISDHRLLKVKTDTTRGTVEMNNVSLSGYAEYLRQILSNPRQSTAYRPRIDLFKELIDRCEYANKRMEIDERFGFRFVANDELETKLSLGDLSSGEKHMLIQVFELLFKAQSGTLVLIDEPELSLHMMWQMNYLKNLEKIIALRHFQCIVATHSPQIFNSMWSKSVDLYNLSVGS
jgi:predicted ATP-binding protein involved in virulence